MKPTHTWPRYLYRADVTIDGERQIRTIYARSRFHARQIILWLGSDVEAHTITKMKNK